ncbi:ubiquitin carboxyl-terminal hydrolase CYLD isoform X1 [Drosophila albomicans]|uniref:ubiquitinyl hydrolase 1 n=1 Tax=Drosophila albomicans TaxID=7291 RepID=A0A6P8XM88_DROAB|nr:ubiquitin carboxyl-terminal hydrolase CYLD isoform X1 [Drosophila albomicans]
MDSNSNNYSKYALITRGAELITYANAANSEYSTDTPELFQLFVEAGTFIKIYETIEGEKCIVQIVDFLSNVNTQLYECKTSDVLPVSEDFWPYVISIANPGRRLRLVRNKDQCRWVLNLKEKDTLSVPGELFKKDIRFDCIIRYIGPVEELNPVGYFFGLEILQPNVCSPQIDSISFAKNYLDCEAPLTIFTTADRITRVPDELSNKLSPRKLINDTFEKITAIVPTVLNIQSRYQGGNNKPLYSNDSAPKRHNKHYINNNELSNNNNYGTLPVKVSNQASEKDATLQSKNSQLEQNISTLNNPTTMSNLKEKEIIVINQSDIEESTKNDNVIVIDNAHDNKNVDLADLLGTNWPANAGGAAGILNGKSLDHKFEKPVSYPKKKEFAERIISPIDQPVVGNTDRSSANYQELHEIPGTKLVVGSLVEVIDAGICADLYGVIRWIGITPDSPHITVGIEVEDDPNLRNLHTSDGTYNGVRLFQCREGGAVFVPSNKCTNDRRFIESEGSQAASMMSTDTNAVKFGHVDCPTVLGAIAPLRIHNMEELEATCGKFKGIQGHHNSCYLDATLFSMFTFTSVFDSILYRRQGPQDISHYSDVQNVLRDEIVNPLRKNVFVRADRVMKLRKLLDQLSSVSGLTSEEKDPEEFLNSLLSQIMRVEPFLKLSSGQDSYFYQLFVEKDERLTFPTVQQLFEQSFHSSDIKLKEVPSCLIIQMPRFGKSFKMYPRILPSQVLDVTNIIEDSPRHCAICGNLAEFECRECFSCLQTDSGLESTTFCNQCVNTIHKHEKRMKHVWKELSIPRDYKAMVNHISHVPRIFMELFAVVCIETSHYVAFVKTGSGPDAPWCFFDSMADRKGEKNGYNIPEMISVPELPQWLSDEGAKSINEHYSKDKDLPEHAKRLFCDAYMCMYQSTEVMMYH